MTSILTPEQLASIGKTLAAAPPVQQANQIQQTSVGPIVPQTSQFPNLQIPQNGQIPGMVLPAPMGAGGLPPQTDSISQLFNQAHGKIKKAEQNEGALLGDVAKQTAESDEKVATALDAQAAAETEQETKKKSIYDEFIRRADEIDAKQLEVQKQAAEQTTIQMNRVSQAAAAVQNTQFKDYFADKSSFAKVLGILAQALGGAANGLAGQPGAPTAMDRVIEQDMQLQMANFNKKKEDFNIQQGLLGTMRQQTQDIIGAQVAYKKAMYEKMGVMLDSMGQKLGTPQTRVDTLKAELAKKSQEMMQKYAQTSVSNLNNALVQDARLDESHAQLEEDLQKHTMAMGAASQKPAKTPIEAVEDDEKYAGLPPVARQKLADKIQATKDFVNAAKELQKLYKTTNGIPIPGDSVSSQQEVAAEALARSMSGSTRPSIAVLGRAREILGGPGGFSKRLIPAAYNENLERIMADQLSSAQSYIKAQGLNLAKGSFLDPDSLIKQGK